MKNREKGLKEIKLKHKHTAKEIYDNSKKHLIRKESKDKMEMG